MKVYFLLFIFVYNGKISAKRQPTNPRSVNLALETVLEFNRNNNADDIHFIDQVQEFLNKVKNVIGERRDMRRMKGSGPAFSEFLVRALEILSNYDDDDLNTVLTIVDEELRKFHYKGCKFHELLENHKVRRYLANKLEEIKGTSVKNIKNDIKNVVNVIESRRFNDDEKDFISYINSLYRFDGVGKLEEFLNNLESYSNKYKRTNMDIGKVIRNGVRSILFDHYSNLKANVRKDLKIKIETFWKNNEDPSKTVHNVWAMGYPTTSKTDAILQYGIARTNPTPTTQTSTANTIETTTKNLIKEEISRYYDKIDLIDTIKEYISGKKLKKEIKSEETTKKVKSKKKNKHHKGSFELSSIKHSESEPNRERDRHIEKKKRKHKKKDRKHKRKSTEPQSIEKTKPKRHHKPTHTISDDDVPIVKEKTKKRHSKYKVTVPIARMQPIWRENEKRSKKKLRTGDKNDKKPLTSQESLEGNDSFNRHRENDEKSLERKPSAKHNKDSRKWFKKQTTKTTAKGISIEHFDPNKNSTSTTQNGNTTTSTPQIVLTNGTIEFQLRAVEDKTQKPSTRDSEINDITYDVLDFWQGTSDFDTKITKANITETVATKAVTNAIKINVTEKIKTLNKTEQFAAHNNKSIEKVTKNVVLNATFPRTKLVSNTQRNDSKINNNEKHRVRLQIREDLSKILGKTFETTTLHDVINFTDPLQDLEDVVDFL